MINYSLKWKGNIIKVLLYIIIVYPFFKPYYFAELGLMPLINKILFLISLTTIGIFYILKLPYINFNSGVRFIIIYYILILISTISNNSFNYEYYSIIAFSFGFGLLLSNSLRNKNHLISFLSAIYILLYIYVVANLIAMYLYPNGIPSITVNSEFPNFVFGNENSLIKVVLPGLCFSFLYDLLRFRKIRKRSWLLLALVWLTLLKTWSVTSMLGLFVFTFFVLNKIGKRQPFFWYFSMLTISIVLSLLLVFLKYESNILVAITEFFGKSLTFSGRDVLWMKAIESIKLNPMWGYGIQESDIIRWYIGNRHGSHNYYLDTLFRGGLVALFFLIIGLIYFGKKIIKLENNPISRTIIGTCCAYFIMWVAEPFISTEYLMFSVLFVLISQIDIVLEYYYDS